MAVVYGLFASDRPNVIRYVGQTIGTAARRRKRHVEAAHSAGTKYPVHHWIGSVEARGARVEVVTLIDDAVWNDDEISEIKRRRAAGDRLMNCTDGGDGHLNPTAETRAKLSAVRTGAKRNLTDADRARRAQTMRVIRYEHVGSKRSAATCAKLAGENNGAAKMNSATVLAMRDLFARGVSIPQIARDHGCRYSTCYAAVMRHTWRTL